MSNTETQEQQGYGKHCEERGTRGKCVACHSENELLLRDMCIGCFSYVEAEW